MRLRQKFYLVMGFGLIAILFSQIFFSPVSAAPNDIVINEIMYSPSSDNNDHEFLELYNNTASPIDLEGWCFTDGISLCFSAGMSIDANGYVLVSPDAAQTLSTYGQTVIAEYSGNLSNGGETITLEDDTSTVVSSISYDDTSPWPITPDGEGPSLELNDPLGDTTSPDNWGASTLDYGDPAEVFTPNAQNNIYNSGYPIITNVTDPNGVTASTSVPITAQIEGASVFIVQLYYRTGFDSESAPIEMHDDGAHGDGAASDGVFGASLPGQAAGTLVRFRIEATNLNGTSISPRYDNTQNYHGYYIAESVSTNSEVLEWFIDDADYTDMLTNHRLDNEQIPSVIVYGDDVYDASTIRVRGDAARYEDKASYKIRLPKGYAALINGTTIPNRVITLKAFAKHTGLSWAETTWWVYQQSGIPVPETGMIYLQKNGEFEGYYLYMDKYENEWRDEYGYNDGELYEDAGTPFDDTVANGSRWSTFYSALSGFDRNDPLRSDYVLDNLNIPATLNFMVGSALVGIYDGNDVHNLLSYWDDDTERWEFLPWDQDGASTFAGISPYDRLFDYHSDTFFSEAVYGDMELRSIYMRRLRTVLDKTWTDNEFIQRYTDLNATYADDIALDLAKWPTALQYGSNIDTFTRPSLADSESSLVIQFKRRSGLLFAYQRIASGIPASQTDTERQQVSIAQVVSSATNSDEFIRLSNNASTAVDISSWYIEGINYTIPEGVVIPAGGSIYLLRDDVAYRATHTPVLVGGEYSTDLSNVPGTNLVLKTDTDMEIDTYDY